MTGHFSYGKIWLEHETQERRKAPMEVPLGWECERCGRINSPYVRACPCYGELKALAREIQVAEIRAGKIQAGDIIEDGFGSAISAYCPSCGRKTMQTVRPGKFQCSHCG